MEDGFEVGLDEAATVGTSDAIRDGGRVGGLVVGFSVGPTVGDLVGATVVGGRVIPEGSLMQ